jgi:inhibitor of cysteine peptidase
MMIVMICTAAAAASASVAENYKKGDLVDICVSENPSTGYMWEIMMTPGLTLVDSTYTQSRSTMPLMVGTAGVRRFTLRCEQSGDQFICLYSHRPWMPINSAEEQQQLQKIVVA